MINGLIQKVNDERDNIILVYGPKRTGKRNLRNLIVTAILKYYERVLVEGNIINFNFKFSALVKDLDTRFSDLYLKKEGYREQFLTLLNSLLKPIDKKFIKEKIEGTSSKCAFFELSRIIDEEDTCETEFVKSITAKASGLYVITYNKIPNAGKCKTKRDFIAKVLKSCRKEAIDTPMEAPLARLYKNFDSLYTKVICTLNPYSIASRQSYGLIQSLPKSHVYLD